MIKVIVVLSLLLCSTVMAADFSLPITVDNTTLSLLKDRWGTAGTPASNSTVQDKASTSCSELLNSLADEHMETKSREVVRLYKKSSSVRRQVILDGINQMRQP
jgi:hypothetical protein